MNNYLTFALSSSKLFTTCFLHWTTLKNTNLTYTHQISATVVSHILKQTITFGLAQILSHPDFSYLKKAQNNYKNFSQKPALPTILIFLFLSQLSFKTSLTLPILSIILLIILTVSLLHQASPKLSKVLYLKNSQTF